MCRSLAMELHYPSESSPPLSNKASAVNSSGGASPILTYTAAKNGSILEGPVVVIIRHGKTEYNKLGIFTGATS